MGQAKRYEMLSPPLVGQLFQSPAPRKPLDRGGLSIASPGERHESSFHSEDSSLSRALERRASDEGDAKESQGVERDDLSRSLANVGSRDVENARSRGAARLKSPTKSVALRDATNRTPMRAVARETELRVQIARMMTERQESESAWAKRVDEAKLAASSSTRENEEWLMNALQSKAKDASLLEVKNQTLSKRVVELENLAAIGENNLRDALDRLDLYRVELQSAVKHVNSLHEKLKASKRAKNEANAEVKSLQEEVARLSISLERAKALAAPEEPARAAAEIDTVDVAAKPSEDVVESSTRGPSASSPLPANLADASLRLMAFIVEQPRPFVAFTLAFIHFLAVLLFIHTNRRATSQPPPAVDALDAKAFVVAGFLGRAFDLAF